MGCLKMTQLWLVIWKSTLIFFSLIILARLIGKKLLSQMTFFDFVVGITIGTISGAYVTSAIKGLWVLLSPVLLTLFSITTGFVMVKSLTLRKLFEGEPVIVIHNGKILEKNMFKLRYHLDDLEMQLRDKGVFDFGQVEFAVLEPHGQLSVLKKTQYQPITPKDLNLSTSYQGMAAEIIKDGDLLEQNLTQNNLSKEWLLEKLRQRNITDLSQVAYASLNTDGTLYVDLKADKLEYIQKVEDKIIH